MVDGPWIMAYGSWQIVGKEKWKIAACIDLIEKSN
jgi:hypothetical protein